MKLKRLLLTVLVVVITICTIKFQFDIIQNNQESEIPKYMLYKREESLKNEVEEMK